MISLFSKSYRENSIFVVEVGVIHFCYSLIQTILETGDCIVSF